MRRGGLRLHPRGMPVVLVTGGGRANSIAAGVIPRLAADGWDVVTSELDGGDHGRGARVSARARAHPPAP